MLYSFLSYASYYSQRFDSTPREISLSSVPKWLTLVVYTIVMLMRLSASFMFLLGYGSYRQVLKYQSMLPQQSIQSISGKPGMSQRELLRVNHLCRLCEGSNVDASSQLLGCVCSLGVFAGRSPCTTILLREQGRCGAGRTIRKTMTNRVVCNQYGFLNSSTYWCYLLNSSLLYRYCTIRS